MKKRVFISFDFDNNLSLKNLLVGQAKNPDSPFEISDWSLKEAAPEWDWMYKAEQKIKCSDIVVVIAGTYTYCASGVKKEIALARKHDKKVVQIKPIGTNPIRVYDAGVMYDWTWENLKKLLS
ncbi:TIR domain-containing protein [Odoribacter laneus]|uniref:Thoeris protein ThsB TIR-like domain-containing protein n=1 Tax=Odoribacter laneus YIT 12061 TaxID=742817 RepID=H1DE22_9BACT|nr:TIR domain-containing protein [Odoribacter laneus]EHP50819.1 hypothetical protein HMPREF9449_00508 [Odoribacter laneus YIT 12061]